MRQTESEIRGEIEGGRMRVRVIVRMRVAVRVSETD